MLKNDFIVMNERGEGYVCVLCVHYSNFIKSNGMRIVFSFLPNALKYMGGGTSECLVFADNA